PAADAELDDRLRSLVQDALEYLRLLDEGKQPQEQPNFPLIVLELERDGHTSGSAIAAKAELAGLLRKLDQLDNHWLAEARRNRRKARRVGRDVNGDNIDDSVQRTPDRPVEPPRPSADELAERAAERREELARRVDDDPQPDADEPDHAYAESFWRRHGEEITLLLVALDYCDTHIDLAGTADAADIAQLPPSAPPQELLERLRNEFEGRYLEFDEDYTANVRDLRMLRAVGQGLSVKDAMALNQEHLLNAKGTPDVVLEPEIEPEPLRARAAVLEYGTPAAIQAHVPWRPMDPREVARVIREGQHVE
ncbi:MAG TPA: hypothetical protein VHU91_08435, partial [Mycobacteriales bacterium]|nr:hypothetical protein [Mycobacteriales bacterium]